MNRILLLEDDVSLIDGLVYSLKKNEFDVEVARTVCEAKQYLSELDRYDLLILDVTLPDGTGFDICEKVRKENQQIPIIFLTASDEEVSIIRGLDSGGDDYITKPFGIMEFLSRVRAALRRSEPETHTSVYSFHEILLDNARHSVTVSGVNVDLTYKEYSLLRLLLEHTNLVVTRETILQVVWGTDISVESRTVDMHIRTLRKKLGDAGKYICTVRKVGYKLADSEEEPEE